MEEGVSPHVDDTIEIAPPRARITCFALACQADGRTVVHARRNGDIQRPLRHPERGLLVFAESHYQQRAKLWVRGFRDLGTQWGVLRNLSDIPYFASTRESRLLRLADFVSHSVFLLYERADVSLAKSIVHRMDQKDGRIHGLVHISTRKGVGCDCPVCASRRVPHNFGVCS